VYNIKNIDVIDVSERKNNKIDILSLSKQELKDYIKIDLSTFNIEPFRADQIYSWLYKNIESFEDMANISAEQRKIFDERFYINKINLIQKFESKIDGTVKYLFELDDLNKIESVLMRYKHGNSVCISTQAGCRMNCAFCASAIGGLTRNLLPSEMLLQIMYISKDIGERISNVVLMGIGEPLDNFNNVMKFLELINSGDGLNIGYRHISLSTCGIADKIEELRQKNLPVTLSVSLHAPNDEIRNKIMPVNKKWAIDKLLKICYNYVKTTKRRITFEYILIQGLNDRDSDAFELSQKLKNILCHVNLIPANDVPERKYKASHIKNINRFCQILRENGVNATVRRKCGKDINASCGQLRNHRP